MKKLLLVLVLAAFSVSVADAGIVRMATFPVRHPISTVKDIGKVIKTVLW